MSPFLLSTRLVLAAFLATALGVIPFRLGAAPTNQVVRGADQPFWVPSLEQALAMAQTTGRPIFLMGYSLVGDGSTFTKVGPTYCTSVF